MAEGRRIKILYSQGIPILHMVGVRLDYNHDSISGRYNQITDLVSLNQTVKTKEHLTSFIDNRSSVLEIGCGNGDVAVLCAKRGADVFALDISKNMIDNAKKLAEKNQVGNIEFIQKNILEFNTDYRFDYIILCYFLNVLPDEKSVTRVFEKIRPYLKHNGCIIIADELEPKNFVLNKLVNLFRYPVFYYFKLKAGVEHHKIHDLNKILKKIGFKIVDEKRFLFQYCSVIIAKV